MSRLALTAVVYGTPAPQGSKKARPIYRGSAKNGTRQFTGQVVLREMSEKLAPWREAVRTAVAEAVRSLVAHDMWEGVIREPVEVRITFALQRPKSASVSRRPWPCVSPDQDKLIRSTLDGITMSGAWADDNLVVKFCTEKVYVGTPGAIDRPGAVVELWTLEDVPLMATATSIPSPQPMPISHIA